MASIVFLVNVLICLTVLVEYCLAEWPQGSFYYCQLPYMVSIASFKTFSVPMYYVLTVAAHFTFSEIIFGDAICYREPNGALKTSPLPRDPVSIAAVGITAVAFLVWFLCMLVSCVGVIVAFAPVLIVPAFILPIATMYLPCKTLDLGLIAIRHAFNTPVVPAKELAFEETILILKGSVTQVRADTHRMLLVSSYSNVTFLRTKCHTLR